MAKDLTQALAELSQTQGTTRQDKALAPPKVPPAIPQRAGTATSKTAAGQGSGGIASPLTETAYADRTFHPEQAMTSTDGIFTLKIKPVKTINLTDAGGAAVTIEFKAP